jgi:hypothetical protein
VRIVLDQAPRDRGREQGLAGGDDSYRVQELVGARVFEQEAARARAQRLAHGGIPAYPRSSRKRHDRPEVAGSSPVAPVKALQIGICI